MIADTKGGSDVQVEPEMALFRYRNYRQLVVWEGLFPYRLC
jgi:hypothetical protein